MGFPISLVTQLPTIISGVISLVNTVEKLVRKPKSGAIKKEMVLDSILADIEEDANAGETTPTPEPDGYWDVPAKLLFLDGKYNWTCLIGKLPALRVAIGNLIDAVVAVKNVLAECDE
jgi:hypothetical protein